LLELGFAEPAPLLDEVSLHVADECDRPAEPDTAEFEKVAN